MNDHELDLALSAMGQQRTAVADLPELHEVVRSTAATAPPHPGFLTPFRTWRFQTMFSATKFVVGAVIVALFGGFLLSGVLTQPRQESVPAVGASASASVSEEPSGSPEATPRPQPVLDVRELEWAPIELDEATFGKGARLVAVAASDSMIVVGGSVDGSAALWTSTDRVTWDRIPHDEAIFGGPVGQEIKAIVPWRDGFVAAGEVGGSDLVVWVSEVGTTWTRVPHDEGVFGGKGGRRVFDAAATDDRLAIAGHDPSDKDSVDAWTSMDGFAWTRGTGRGGEMLAIAGAAEGFVGVGHRGLWKSVDGEQWEEVDASDVRPATLLAVTSTPGGFVAVGEQGEPAAWTSPDGANWTPAVIDAPFGDGEWWGPNDVAFADSGLAASAGPGDTGGESRILVSPDGETWTLGDTAVDVTDACLGGIASFDSHFVAIGPGSSNCGVPSSIWTTSEPQPPTLDAEGAPGADTSEAGTFSPAGSLAEAERDLHIATLLPDGRVLVVGGERGGDFGVLRVSAEIWEPSDR